MGDSSRPFRNGDQLKSKEKWEFQRILYWHNAECDDFMVQRITETTSKRMNEDEE